MKFESKFGLGEIVIRETHKNGKIVQERMMEVISIIIEPNLNGSGIDIAYCCEDTMNGHRQVYREAMLVGDPDFDQDLGKYPKGIIDSDDTNKEEAHE